MASALSETNENGLVSPIVPSQRSSSKIKVKAGPEPLLLSRKEIDVLYEILDVTRKALNLLKVEYIVTGGSLLGAIRQHSILFCDDDIDIAIVDPCYGTPESIYETQVLPKLQSALDNVVDSQEAESNESKHIYQIKPWEGGDRIRSRRFNNVFLDLFVLRKYPTLDSFVSVIGRKKNGQAQPETYIEGILDTIRNCVAKTTPKDALEEDSVFPFWQFATRKAVELWPKEVYLASTSRSQSKQEERDELFPLQRSLKFGPLTDICGPQTPVTLLKRAFGDDCFEVYYRSISHQQAQPALPKRQQLDKKALPPKVAPGGTWEASPKVPLEDEHYLPMQPLARKRRRPTMHCKNTLMEYLQIETIREEGLLRELMRIRQGHSKDTKPVRPRRTVYMDGVFDLFHIGHLEAIRQCAALGDRVILGVTGDSDAEGYKRRPIVPQSERTAIVRALEEVNDVVCPCPLVVTQEFMDKHEIDLVVHGFANDADAEKQHEFFEIPMAMGKFQRIGYYRGLSTTDRLKNIRDQNQNESDKTVDAEIPTQSTKANDQRFEKDQIAKPQWFGATLAAASNYSPMISTDPFPIELRLAIETHIEKARVRRREALEAIHNATDSRVYDSILKTFHIQLERLNSVNSESLETEFEEEAHRKLVSSLLESAGFSPLTDLSNLHKEPLVDGKSAKDRLLHALTQNYSAFQESYDTFVRKVCVPRLVKALNDENCTKVYYQAFPCLRIVQPGEFSIGPHSDVAYGHHPCSVNGYVSLTEPDAGGNNGMAPVSALFLESRPGAEDWHSLFGRNNSGKCHTRFFAGALNLHWTTENLTEDTRVTFDFRMIDGKVFEELKDGGHLEGGQKDVFRETPGYYHVCYKSETGEWIRENKELESPDFRVGFPWTVKNWEKFWKKNAKP